MELFYQTLLFFLGASIASFVNAWAIRLGHDESIMNSSRCRSCHKKLTITQLIPIFSWVMQFGKCGCSRQTSLSVRYFLTEIIFALIVLALANSYLPNKEWFDFLFLLIFLSMCLHLFLTDTDYQQLYFPILVLGIIFGLCFGFYNDNFFQHLFGASLGFLLLFIVNWIFLVLRKKNGLGDGDKYLLAMMGAWFGPIVVFQSLILSSWLAILFIGIKYIKLRTIPKKIAYGPFIILASIFIQYNQLFSYF